MSPLFSRSENSRLISEANSLLEKAEAYSKIGEYQRAIQVYAMVLEDIQKVDLSAMNEKARSAIQAYKAQTLNSRGIALKNMGDYQNAITCYQQALETIRDLDQKNIEASVLGNLGVAFKRIGDNWGAINYCEQQLAIVREIGDTRGEGNALSNLANAYGNLGKVEEALQYYNEAIEMDRKLGDPYGEAIDQVNLADFLVRQGRFSEALSHAEIAEQIYASLGNASERSKTQMLINQIRMSSLG